MINKDIFKGKSINLFSPYSNEYLYDFIYLLGFKDKDSNDWKVRLIVLSVLEYLFRLRVIRVYSWCNNLELESKKLTIKETIRIIDKLWLKNTTFPDFYGMVMFGPEEWYIDALEGLGMTPTTNWETFVKSEIGGDLELWINEHMPRGNRE